MLLKEIIKSIRLEPLFLLYYFSVSLQYPTKSALWYRKVCMILHNDDWICDNINQNDSLIELEEEVQVMNSQWNFYDDLCSTIPSMLLTFLYGSWSDRISRKIPIMLPMIGNFISCLLYIFAAEYIRSPCGFMLLISFIENISGGSSTFFMAMISYQSHITIPKNRTLRISLLYSCMYVGSFAGFVIAGALLDSTGFTFVFSVSLILTSISLIYCLFVVREVKQNTVLGNSVPDAQSSETQKNDETMKGIGNMDEVKKHLECNMVSDEISAEIEIGDNKKEDTTAEDTNTASTFCSFQHVKEPVLVAFRKRMYNHRVHILAIILCNGLHNIFNADWYISYLYLKHPPLAFTQTQYGFYTGYRMLVACICTLVAVPIAKERLKISDSILYPIAIGSFAVDMLIMGLSSSSWMIWLAPLCGFMAESMWTLSRSMLSTMVDVNEIGKISAVLSSVQDVCSLLGSFLYNYLLYPATVDFYAGFSYIFSAIAFTIPTGIAIWIHFDVKKQKRLRSKETVNHICTKL